MEIQIRRRYLNLAVSHGAPERHLRLLVDGRLWRGFDVSLAEGTPDFWAPLDVGELEGRDIAVECDGVPALPSLAAAIVPDDAVLGAERLYQEELRPRFHFTTRRGWTNDPNGLVYHAGEYHLFYQHNPYGCRWGNMHWGHAVSSDLLHWDELGEALAPDGMGTVFSGSAVADRANTAGFATGVEAPLVCVYTAAGGRSPESRGRPFTQCLAFSNDLGRSWVRCATNPVLDHIVGENRDPKVIWHAPTLRWVMALYLDGSRYALFASKDLSHWQRLCELELPGAAECPDFFPLSVNGQETWVFWTANGTYCLGDFDGWHFKRAGEPERLSWGDAYAAQTWSDAPVAGKRLQISWLRGDIPNMPFNQMMGFPVELTLEEGGGRATLRARPVAGVRSLYRRSYVWRSLSVAELGQMLSSLTGESLHLKLELDLGATGRTTIVANGIAVTCDRSRAELSTPKAVVPLVPDSGRVPLELLIDRTSVEAFIGGGRAYIALSSVRAAGTRPIASATGAEARVLRAEVHELSSIWG